jgi:hypothetical protein
MGYLASVLLKSIEVSVHDVHATVHVTPLPRLAVVYATHGKVKRCNVKRESGTAREQYCLLHANPSKAAELKVFDPPKSRSARSTVG